MLRPQGTPVSDVEEKLERGYALIGRSAGEPEMLGMALLAIHGALEAQLRSELRARQDLTADERRMVVEPGASGAPLIALAQRYLGLGHDELELVRAATLQRRDLARGEPYRGSAAFVASYARVVEARCGLGGALDAALIEYRHTRMPPPEPPPAPVQPPRRRRISIGGIVAVTIMLLALLFAASLLYGLLDVERMASAVGLGAPPTVTPGPQATAGPPTPGPHTAKIVRLGGSIGWLRETASFAAPTLPPRLAEGAQVTLLDQQAADTDGNIWQFVSYDGYDGWVPQNNLEMN